MRVGSTTLALVVAAAACASCAGLREHERTVDRYSFGRRACDSGDPSGCREAVAGAEALSARGMIVGSATVNDVLKRGCELGVPEHCRLAVGLGDEEKGRFMMRACRRGDPDGCAFVLGYGALATAARAQAGARFCELSATNCVRFATQLVADEPELAARVADRGCALDAATCVDAETVFARSRVPDACFRRHGDWDDCASPSKETDVLRRACAGGSEAACALLGERLVEKTRERAWSER